MKTIGKYVLSAMVIACLTINMDTFAQVGIGNTNPDTSSMLDIQSTTKGVLIPRMTTVQRTAISPAATGLLVFDSTSQSFWFYSGAWVELAKGGKLADTDGDTKVEVEQGTDEDKIRFTTAGTERMTIDKDGNTRIGNGIDNTYIETDGSLSYEGAATRYDDLKVPVSSTTKGGSKEPVWGKLRDNGSSQGVFIQWFEDKSNVTEEEELYFTTQMPHQWKEGTEIFPHVHWTAKSDVGSDKVVWGLEYTWANVGVVFGNTTIITGSDPITAIGTVSAYEHAITSLGTITSTGNTLSSMLVCRIFRKSADGIDTFNASAGLLEIDFHFQIDSDGSRTEYGK